MVRSSVVVLDRVVGCVACSLAMMSRERSLLRTCARCESLCEPAAASRLVGIVLQVLSLGGFWLSFDAAQAMNSVSEDHARLNRQFLEERLRDQMEDVVLTQRRRCRNADEIPRVQRRALGRLECIQQLVIIISRPPLFVGDLLSQYSMISEFPPLL